MLRIASNLGAVTLAVVCLLSKQAGAQSPKLTLVAASNFAAPEVPFDAVRAGSPGAIPVFTPAPELPRMSQELALATFQERLQQQLAGVPSYSASTVIAVELPDTNQRGVFELRKGFSAPHTLKFMPVHYSGD